MGPEQVWTVLEKIRYSLLGIEPWMVQPVAALARLTFRDCASRKWVYWKLDIIKDALGQYGVRRAWIV